MRYVLLTAAIAAVTVSAVAAENLDGKKIHLVAGDAMSVDVPIALPCDATCDGIPTVVEPKTGKTMPATLRNGELVFVCEGALPKTEHDYVVKVVPKTDSYAPKVRIEKRGDEDILDVFIEDKLFTAYNYSNTWKKPFMWPLNTVNGTCVTRDWPMKDKLDFVGIPEAEQKRLSKDALDHIHHKSLWISHGDINGVDCWGEGEGSGFQTSGEVTSGSGDAYGWVHAKNVWEDAEHKPLINEEREYRIYMSNEKARLIDISVTFTAAYGDVKWGDTKEGGIVAVRMRPELSGKYGTITNALGDQKEANLWGKPAPWCDYSGNIEGVGQVGLTVFDNPKNFRFPACWHVRMYGLMGANYFGYSHFSEKEYNKALIPANGDYQMKQGETLPFTHRVYVHAGDVHTAKVADRYADYTTPPKVEWVQ